MRTHHSYLPFYYNSQEKQFFKGILGRKSHCIMIKGKLIELLSPMEPLCEKSQQLKAVTYLQKVSSYIFESILN